MDRPHPGTAHEALGIFVGRWLGTTELASSPWGPARIATAEVTFTRAAGGFAVVQTYRHTEADGTHFEGHGVFTVDPDHDETLWYYVDSMGRPPAAPARGAWHDSTLTVERHSDRGTARHSSGLIMASSSTPPNSGWGTPGLQPLHDVSLPPGVTRSPGLQPLRANRRRRAAGRPRRRSERPQCGRGRPPR